MNSDITSGYEYVVAQKNEGKFRTMKILFLLLYATYVIGVMAIILKFAIGLVPRKEMLKLTLKSCSAIAPLNDEHKAKIDAFAPTVTFNALSSIKAEDAYFALFETEDGQKAVFYFEATEKMLKICRMYNSSATVMSKVRF